MLKISIHRLWIEAAICLLKASVRQDSAAVYLRPTLTSESSLWIEVMAEDSKVVVGPTGRAYFSRLNSANWILQQITSHKASGFQNRYLLPAGSAQIGRIKIYPW